MANLYALCRNGGEPHVKRVQITQPVQNKIEGMFQAQAATFLDGVNEEVDFSGDWNPDPDELLVIEPPQELELVIAALEGNVLALPVVDATNFIGESIRGIFISLGDGANRKVYFQSFTAQQILARRFSLMLDGDTFKELTEPAFTLENSIVAIFENNKLKFKKFFNVKRIFQLKQFYQEASDHQIEGFCAHASLAVADVPAFKDAADQTVRRLVHAITKTGVLNEHPVEDIAGKAQELGLDLEIADGKIAMPADRKEIKNLLRFLDDGIYEASLTAKRYVTNSKRPLVR